MSGYKVASHNKSPDYIGTYFSGRVVDIEDPLQINRIKIYVQGLWEEPISEMPWVAPIKWSPFGQGSGWGVYGSPAVGSVVGVILQNGDPHYPLYVGSLHIAQHANPNYPDARVWGYTDPSNNILIVNMNDNSWFWHHHSGCTVRFNEQGDNTVHITRNCNVLIEGDAAVVVNGNSSIHTVQNSTITVDQNAYVNVQGNVDGRVQGDTSLVVGGTLQTQANRWNHQGPFYIDGELTVNGIAFTPHKHSGVQTGGGTSGPPVQTLGP